MHDVDIEVNDQDVLSTPGATPGRRRAWRVWLLLTCSVLFAAGLLERVIVPACLHVREGRSREQMLLGFTAIPNTQIDDVSINSQGFSGQVLSKPRPGESTVRIVTLGGSAFFQRRMTDRLIEGLSGTTLLPLEIQGGALGPHTTRSSLIEYERWFARFRPRYVLIYHGINDLGTNHVKSTDFRADYSHADPWNRRTYLLDHSVIARLVYNSVLHPLRRPRRAVGGNGAHFMAYKSFDQNIRSLVDRIRSDGGTPILMTFAWYIPANYTQERFKKGNLDYSPVRDYERRPVELWGEANYVWEGLEHHNALLRRIAAEKQVLLIDQNEMLKGTPGYFDDVCHLSDAGTDVFIRHIVDFFTAQGLLSPEAVR